LFYSFFQFPLELLKSYIDFEKYRIFKTLVPELTILVRKYGRDQSDTANKNREEVWKAFRSAEKEVFEKEGKWYVTTSDIKKHTNLSLTTIYKKLKDLKREKQIHEVESRRYSSKITQWIKRMAGRFLIRDDYEENITARQPLIFLDQWLSLISAEYSDIKEKISPLKKSKIKRILRSGKIIQLYNQKTRIEQDEKEKFLPLKDLVIDATTISILSGHFLHPYPLNLAQRLQRHTSDNDGEAKRVGIYLEELRNAVWRMLMLFTGHPYFSLEHSGLTVVINFDPREVLKSNEKRTKFKEYLKNLDRLGWYNHFIETWDEHSILTILQ